MIKVTDKSTIKPLYFPKTNPQKYCHIVLYGMSEEVYDLGEEIYDLSSYEDFYMFELDLSNIPDGEYKWVINNYECGLLIIGDLKMESMARDDKDTYVQDHEQKDEIVIFYE